MHNLVSATAIQVGGLASGAFSEGSDDYAGDGLSVQRGEGSEIRTLRTN